MTVGQLVARMVLDPKPLEKDLKKQESFIQKHGLNLGGIFKQAFSFGLGMGLVSGFKSLGGAITDFVNTAARTEVLNVAMQSVAKASGYAITALREQREAVMDLGIAEQEATQILTRFMQAQLDTADAAKLARVAQDAAVIAGYNSSQAAEQMTEAIAKQRPELLSAFGMTRNMNEIYSDYAKTIGKTTTQLVEAEKKQAMLNYILKEGEKIAGTYEASMGVVGKQISSLPRYWDTLKNAIAKPLALPALSVIVEAVTNGLKNAIKWAETNVATLQKWGRTAADVAGFIIRAFKSVSQIFVRNWSVIRFATVALLTYVTATKAASLATSLFRTVSLLLSGNLSAQSGILGFLNNVIVYYKVQMLGATATTNIFTAALYKLKAALYAVNTAIGPVGWVLIALSLLVAGGMALWNKYAQAMNEAWEASFAEKMRKQQEKLKGSTKGAAAVAEDQADALNEAGKAAAQNLQSFDEVHQLQEDMADVAGLDMPSLDPFELEGFDLPEIDFSETLERQKATFAGFMQWIGEGLSKALDKVKAGWESFTDCVSNLWEGVKTKWNDFCDWIKGWDIWGWIGNRWDRFKTWAAGLWDGVKTKWNDFINWPGELFGSLWEGVKKKWNSFKNWAAGLWDGVKTKWGNFTGWVQEKWSSFKTKAGEIWTGIKTNVQTKWEELKTNAPVIWENIKTSIQTRWENLKTSAGETWNNITTGIKEKWNDLNTNAPIVWENIKKEISNRWEALKTNAPIVWNNISKTIKDSWKALKTKVPVAWNDIKNAIANKWREIKDDAVTWGKNLISGFVQGVKDKIGSVKDTFKNVGNTIKNFLGFSSPTKEGPGREADKWAPNFMDMFRSGIAQGIPGIRTSVNAVADEMSRLSSMTVQPAIHAAAGTADSGIMSDSIAQAVYRAIIDAFRITQASSTGTGSGESKELVLKIDNTVLARMQLPALRREAQRQGLNLIVQGV